MVELELAYKAAVVGSSEYIKQGRNKLTRLVQEYDAGKTEYSLQKEDNLIKQKYMKKLVPKISSISFSPLLKMRG